MLDVNRTHQIIAMHFVEGLSARKIAQKLKIHRKTVTSRIEEYNQFKNGIAAGEGPLTAELANYLANGTVYDSSSRSVWKLSPEIAKEIDACLAENDKKRLDGRRKQQLRKIDIHEKLVASGLEISYSSVCKYIARKTMQSQEAFIKQAYSPGESCEFDWGEVRLDIAGKRRKFYFAVFTSAYSNYRYSILFERQNSLAFRESHIIFFAHVGGAWRQMTYDNMRVAVAQFVGKSEKVPTEALKQLGRWYLFDWRFCNTARGNEKGHVENSIEYIRRKTFAFKDDFETFQEAQDYLMARVLTLNQRVSKGAKKSPYAKFQEEKAHLLANSEKMECFDVVPAKVSKLGAVCIGTNHYSVPDRFCGRMLSAKLYSSQLEIGDGKEVVCTHSRSYERNKWYLNLDHYLITLSRKPGAVGGSVALKQAPEFIQRLYKRHFRHAPREFIEMLLYCKRADVSHARLQETVEKLMRHHTGSVEADHILALLGNQPESDTATVEMHQPNAITAQAMENLAEMTLMMG